METMRLNSVKELDVHEMVYFFSSTADFVRRELCAEQPDSMFVSLRLNLNEPGQKEDARHT
jgi:hypothetical protein